MATATSIFSCLSFAMLFVLLQLQVSAQEKTQSSIPKAENIFSNFTPSTLTFAESLGQTPKGRYMEKNCSALSQFIDKSSPGGTGLDWSGLPVQQCRYSAHGLQATVTMLNPSSQLLAQWIVDACQFVRRDTNECRSKINREILNASGSQFPIAGGVIEKMWQDRPAKEYNFKNGVTVGGKYGRPISVTRSVLANYCAQTAACKFRGDQGSQSFPDEIASLYRESWQTGVNHIIRAKAMEIFGARVVKVTSSQAGLR